MKKIAVVLSGCGFLDGSEIYEATFTLLELDKHKVEVTIFAPDENQHYVINHLTKEQMSEKRNILVESARIARGKIQSLDKLKVEDFDSIILPGGYGAALNLCDIGIKNEAGAVLDSIKTIILQFYNASKPIGAMCIAPVILASVLKEHAIRITLGEHNELIKKLGATEQICTVQDIVIDKTNRIVTTPAFMINAPIAEIHKGISNLVTQILSMIEQGDKS